MSLEKPDAIEASPRSAPPIVEAAPPSYLSNYTPLNSGEFLLESLWRIVQKRKWIIIASVVVVFTIVLIISARMTPIYDAQCSITLSKPVSDSLGLKDPASVSADDYWDYAIELETQTKILRSDALALQVIRNLQLDKNPSFTGPRQKKTAPQSAVASTDDMNPDSGEQSALLSRFLSGLRVSPVPRTKILEIHYTHPDPKLAATIVNALADAYIELNIRTKYESTMQTSDWISKQLSDLRLKTETAQEKLVRYQKEHGILGIDEKQNIITSKLDELNRQLTIVEGDRIQKEADYRMVASDPEALAKAEPNGVINKLQQDRGTLLTRYAELNTTFGPSYPKVVELKNQLDDINSQIQAEAKRIERRLKGDYLTAVQREKMLSAALENQKREANQLNESAIEYNLLKRDLETSRQLYEGLLQRLKEAGVSAGLRSNNIRIIDAARTPTSPSSPNIPRNLTLAFIVGLVGGVMLAFIQEAMDNTLRTPEQIQAISSLPSLGFIPLEAQLSKGMLLSLTSDVLRGSSDSAMSSEEAARAGLIVLQNKPFSEMAESYRALRTSILLSSLGAPPKVILVTSPLPQEGKTTTAMNCAAALAQQGSRVLLIDADMRRPRIASALNLDSTVGLSNLLTGSAPLEDVVQAVPQVPNLFAIASGPIPPHPAELLGSDLMEQHLAVLRERFDHIVIDSPPALSVTDAVMLSARVDSVLIVVFAGRTRKEALRRVRELFTQVNARLMGVVVNGVDVRSPDHYYYYYGKRYGDSNYYRERSVKSADAEETES
jgi:capsular exopolysaccharide synthesis family protein